LAIRSGRWAGWPIGILSSLSRPCTSGSLPTGRVRVYSFGVGRSGCFHGALMKMAHSLASRQANAFFALRKDTKRFPFRCHEENLEGTFCGSAMHNPAGCFPVGNFPEVVAGAILKNILCSSRNCRPLLIKSSFTAVDIALVQAYIRRR